MISPATDKILARELGRLGGFASGLVARLMPSNVGSTSLESQVAPTQAAQVVQQLLAAIGSPLRCEDPELSDALCAVIGSGYLRMNPALVCVWIRSGEQGGSSLVVQAVAKEGLIKQRGGEQAAREVEERLRSALSARG